jgi:hypothetical protein
MNKKMDLTESISGFIAGENPIRVAVGLDSESAVKLGIVAIVTTLIIVLIIRKIK